MRRFCGSIGRTAQGTILPVHVLERRGQALSLGIFMHSGKQAGHFANSALVQQASSSVSPVPGGP